MRGGEALVEDQRLGGAAGMATASPPAPYLLHQGVEPLLAPG